MNLVSPPDYRHDTVLPLPLEVKADAWAVDAACSGNPGPMEYQAIDLQTGAQVFHFGPMKGTNRSIRLSFVPNAGCKPTNGATPSSSGRRRSGVKCRLTSAGNKAYPNPSQKGGAFYALAFIILRHLK